MIRIKERFIIVSLVLLSVGCGRPEESKQLAVRQVDKQQNVTADKLPGVNDDRKDITKWKAETSKLINGAASVSFDSFNDTIYLLGRDSVYAQSVQSGKITALAYHSGPHPAMAGNQSVYVGNWHNSATLLNYYLDRKSVALFDLHNLKWNGTFTYPDTATDYWQTNKFYSPADSSVYVLGGYGHYRYRNEVLKYNLNKASWQKINPTGDFFRPRYLSALGVAKGGAYVLGGYGSAQGRQLLGARNFYDLMFYDVNTASFKKQYELNFDKAVTFANSMIVDETNNLFYALAFENHKYNSGLQLIKGSLHKPAFKWAGNEIPYLFNDIASFADLFYSPKSKKLIAVTMFAQGDKTEVKLYSLTPPHLQQSGSRKGMQIFKTVANRSREIALFSVAAILFLLLSFIKKQRVKRTSHNSQKHIE